MKHIHDWIVGDIVSNIDGTVLWVCESCDIEPVTTTAPSPETPTVSKRDWMKEVTSEVHLYPGVADTHGNYAKMEISFPMANASIQPELSVYRSRAVIKVRFDDLNDIDGFAHELALSFLNQKKMD